MEVGEGKWDKERCDANDYECELLSEFHGKLYGAPSQISAKSGAKVASNAYG